MNRLLSDSGVKLLDEVLEYLGYLKGEKATELNNRLYNEILKPIHTPILTLDTINVRECDECGKEMWDGFCVENGMEYYCSEECLHKHYTDEEWEEMCDDGNGDSYWTDWYDEYEEYKRLKGIKESEE